MLSKYFDENMIFGDIDKSMIKHENVDLALSDKTFKAIKETVDLDYIDSKFVAYLFVDNVDPVIILTKAPISEYEKYRPILDRMLMTMKISTEED